VAKELKVGNIVTNLAVMMRRLHSIENGTRRTILYGCMKHTTNLYYLTKSLTVGFCTVSDLSVFYYFHGNHITVIFFELLNFWSDIVLRSSVSYPRISRTTTFCCEKLGSKSGPGWVDLYIALTWLDPPLCARLGQVRVGGIRLYLPIGMVPGVCRKIWDISFGGGYPPLTQRPISRLKLNRISQ
jgi:hypothetical protein